MVDEWRIDDLAQRAGVTVDTIRYYARERLLPSPTPSGRHKLYGKEHLERLARIRELQEQRFSLAAIRAILDSDRERPGLAQLFGGAGAYTLDELIARSPLDPDLVRSLHEVGLLSDPSEYGREAYDDTDLALLRAIGQLVDIGMTPDVLVELAGIYVRHFRALQADVHAVLAGETREWDEDTLVAMQRELTMHTPQLIPAIDQVLNHVHQRTVQRLTLEAIRGAQETQRGIGGMPLADAAHPDELA